MWKSYKVERYYRKYLEIRYMLELDKNLNSFIDVILLKIVIVNKF